MNHTHNHLEIKNFLVFCIDQKTRKFYLCGISKIPLWIGLFIKTHSNENSL